MSIQRMLSRPRLTGPLAVIVVVFVVVVAQSAAALRGTTASTLAFRTVSLSDAFSPGFGQPGSTTVSKVENRRGTLVIGHDQTACVVIKLPDLQCSSTVGLPGGTVQISFHQSLTGRTIVAPVAGGTARYADVRGDLDLRRELEWLVGQLESARDGHGGVALVLAAAGLGKTTLLREAETLGRQRGLSVFTARGAELEREIPFGLTRQLFERARRELKPEELDELGRGAARVALSLLDARS